MNQKNPIFITLLSILLLLCLTLPTTLLARPSQANPGWFGDIGLEGEYYSYRENNKLDGFFMSDKGPLYGLYYALGYQPECTPFRFAFEGRHVFSRSIQYKSDDGDTMSNSHYAVSELRLLGIYSWDLENCWKLEPYAGLGLRYLHNNDLLRRTTFGAISWRRTSKYYYLPIGLKIVRDLEEGMQVIGQLEYDWFLKGKQTSCSFFNYIENDQNHGYGFRLGVDLLIPSSYGDFDYNFGCFFRYWSIKDSTINRSLTTGRLYYEPRNQTYEIGLRLGLSF